MPQLYENRLHSLLFIENVVTLIKNVDLNLDYDLIDFQATIDMLFIIAGSEIRNISFKFVNRETWR
jgi:hypothetical protein